MCVSLLACRRPSMASSSLQDSWMMEVWQGTTAVWGK